MSIILFSFLATCVLFAVGGAFSMMLDSCTNEESDSLIDQE